MSAQIATVWLDGELMPADQARLPALDRGFLYGDALFETLRAYDGRLPLFERHMRRLQASQRALGWAVPEDSAALLAAARALLSANNTQEAALRITITRGVVAGPLGLPTPQAPHRLLHLRPLPPALPEWLAHGVQALLLEPGQRSALSLAQHKTTSYLAHLLFKERARAAGCWEAVLRASDGTLLEGASSNLFAVRGGTLHTAPLGAGVLPGVMRALCLELAADAGISLAERDLGVQELAGAEEAFLTNSVAEVVPLVRAREATSGDRAGPVWSIAGGAPGPLTRRLQAAVRSFVGATAGAADND